MPSIDDFSISFGYQGDAAAFLGDGWCVPEDGFTWTSGHRTEIIIPRPAPCDYFLHLTHGVCRREGQLWQRVILLADGQPLARYVARHAEEHEVWIPQSVIEATSDPLRLAFVLPDAFRPADDGRGDQRTLGLAFKRLTLKAVLPRKVVRTAMAMESIGRNCEFGLVQRALGLEPISLLRWAGCETADLIKAFDAGFAGLAEEADGQPDPRDAPPDRQHWWLTCRHYGIQFHTGEVVADGGVAEATKKARPRLRWLARKLLEDLRIGEKTFVYSSGAFADPRDGLGLAAAVRRAGGCGPLLLVAAGEAGPVVALGESVGGASVPQLTSMGNAASVDVAQWLRVIGAFAELR